LLEFSKNSFNGLRNPGDVYGVSALRGWFPEWHVPEYPCCENCRVGDILGMTVALSEAGASQAFRLAVFGEG
jgi:hypothetical protein